MAFMFLTSESAKSFQFANECLTDLCFHDCPQPSLICDDFSKGLGAAIALQAAKESIKVIEDKNDFIDVNDTVRDTEVEHVGEFLDSDTIIVDVGIGANGERTPLQLCEWHAIETIKKRLTNRGYSKETREMLVDLLN
jgi:hypothetical protein